MPQVGRLYTLLGDLDLHESTLILFSTEYALVPTASRVFPYRTRISPLQEKCLLYKLLSLITMRGS